jgi:AAA+ superfamily predicted ATPase
MKLGMFGQQGSGKTFLSVLLARKVQKLYPECTIYSNISGEDIVTISDLNEFPFDNYKEYPNELPPPKILIIDEAMFSISSRGSSSNINEIWSRALAMFRKNNVVLTIYATHRPSMLDVRFRDQLDSVVMCRKNKVHFDYLYVDMVTHLQKTFQVPKIDKMFQMANYATREMPMPIEVIELMNHPLFQLKKIERTKVSAKNTGA